MHVGPLLGVGIWLVALLWTGWLVSAWGAHWPLWVRWLVGSVVAGTVGSMIGLAFAVGLDEHGDLSASVMAFLVLALPTTWLMWPRWQAGRQRETKGCMAMPWRQPSVFEQMHGLPEQPVPPVWRDVPRSAIPKHSTMSPVTRAPSTRQGRGASINLPEVVQFDYTDAHGDSTRRTVKVNAFERSHGGVLHGVCYLRHEQRTFRVERMGYEVVREDGEILSTGDWFGRLRHMH